MPESPKNLRLARGYIAGWDFPDALNEVESWGLSSDELLFFWYGDYPADFAQDLLYWGEEETGPTFYQRQILDSIVTDKRVSVMGPHGLGKSCLAAIFVHWFANTRDGLVDWKIVTTASSDRQLTEFLWPEINKWAKRLKFTQLGRGEYNSVTEMMKTALSLRDGRAFKASSNDAEKIEGAHATHLAYLFDEAKAIPADIFNSAEGAFSNAGEDTNNEAYAINLSTPGEPYGTFHDIQTEKPGYEDWRVIQVSLEDTIKAKRNSRDWAQQRARQWGETSGLYINKVLGKFASTSESSVIPATWVELAQERWHERFLRRGCADDAAPRFAGGYHPPATGCGVDIAAGGEDSTCIATLYDTSIRDVKRLPYEANTTRTARLLKSYLTNIGFLGSGAYINIDALGYSGTYDTLEEEGIIGVTPYKGSLKTFARDRSQELGFTNVRSAAYWSLRELLDPEFGEGIALPPSEELLQDLSSPSYREMQGGRIQVQAKDEVKKKLNRSPDMGDAVVMAFWEDAEAEVRPTARAHSARRSA